MKSQQKRRKWNQINYLYKKVDNQVELDYLKEK